LAKVAKQGQSAQCSGNPCYQPVLSKTVARRNGFAGQV